MKNVRLSQYVYGYFMSNTVDFIENCNMVTEICTVNEYTIKSTLQQEYI